MQRSPGLTRRRPSAVYRRARAAGVAAGRPLSHPPRRLTPHGVAALVWSVNPGWTYAQVRDKVFSTVRPISALSGKTVTGGVVNANNAVR